MLKVQRDRTPDYYRLEGKQTPLKKKNKNVKSRYMNTILTPYQKSP